MDEVLKDERFSHIFTDPRFRKMPRNVRKIKVDKRFQDMFKDSRFKSKCKIDKRGREINLTSSEDLKKLYNVTSESSGTEDEETSLSKTKKHPKNKKRSNLLGAEEDENVSKLYESEESIEYQKLSCGDSSEDDSATEVKLNKKVKSKKSEKLKDVSMLGSKKMETNAEMKKSKSEKLNIIKKSLKNKNVPKLDTDINDESNCELYEENNHQSSLELQKATEDNGSSESSEDSSDTDSESDGLVENDNFDHNWEELNKDAPDANQITKRLAVCNMDWDRIRAVDLMAVFNSFKVSSGSIFSAKIYPSEYGLQRMEEERLHGPPELVEKVLGPNEEENEDKNSQRYNREKLRQYQINRLKYYFAVIETDSPETANSLYEQLNGMEYESCSVRFDLRFIPDDVTFEQEPFSVAEEVPTEYKPRLFVTSALQQVKVNLTWDETDPKRQEIFQKAFTDPNSIEEDIKVYLASSSEETSEDENEDEEINNKLSSKDRIAKYRALLQSLEEGEKNEDEKYEKEITYQSGLKEETEEIVKKKANKDNLNPFEEMMKKKKEKLKLKKREKKVKNEVLNESSDEDDSSLSGEVNNESDNKDNKALAELALMSDTKKLDSFGQKQKKRKKNKIKMENLDKFQCDVSDPRFSAIYSSHLYNIDPSDPHFKKTPGNMALLQEKQKKFNTERTTDFDSKKAKKAKYRK